ncbi:nrdI protein [Enterococcus sp. AZ194]
MDLPAYEIEPANPFFEIKEPFVLAVPTYDQEIMDVVYDFLDHQDNSLLLRGIIGSGNRNFAELFVYAAKQLAENYQVPLLHALEFSGTSEDVDIIKKVVNELES